MPDAGFSLATAGSDAAPGAAVRGGGSGIAGRDRADGRGGRSGKPGRHGAGAVGAVVRRGLAVLSRRCQRRRGRVVRRQRLAGAGPAARLEHRGPALRDIRRRRRDRRPFAARVPVRRPAGAYPSAGDRPVRRERQRGRWRRGRRRRGAWRRARPPFSPSTCRSARRSCGRRTRRSCTPRARRCSRETRSPTPWAPRSGSARARARRGDRGGAGSSRTR